MIEFGYCPRCGQQFAEADQFCGRCGAQRTGAVATRPARSGRRRGCLIAPTVIVVLLVAVVAIAAVSKPRPGTQSVRVAALALSSPTPAKLTEAAVVAKVSSSVVQVSTSLGTGSGVRIANGILTNAHVVAGSSAVYIVEQNGQRELTQVLRYDPVRDLALLRDPASHPALALEPAEQQR